MGIENLAAAPCRSAADVAGRSRSVRSRVVPRAAMKDVAVAAADASGLTVKEAEAAVRAAFDFIAAEVTKGEKVTVAGFGTFERRARPARAGRNPRTGEPLTIAARSAPAFVAAKALKDQVDAGEKK